ncbi:hypothetical protein CO181_04205 [candidate division WWE3 bacterium CG_4_9_14_3_um_filter_43_9]|uniref:Nudix hydrolase domain-containing protein n=1 Tax=candidate division WWE3 bacterium CG_4_9_14_3_um_filter_43_9 TaxID=1975082 RepID=A0A2M7WW66_UNCKA|nr:MAG: hypothetical protein CO181_04205 [candidate division WWE3 bacterium CG_4_9_14_3_um_filter_43_9]
MLVNQEGKMEECYHLRIKAIIRNKEGEILLLQVNKATLKQYTGSSYWDLPGGRVQRGEKVEETLRRELFEETGITRIKAMYPFSMDLTEIRIPNQKGEIGLILATYLCEVDIIPKIRLNTENVAANWFLPTEAARLLSVKFPLSLTEKIRSLNSDCHWG